MLSRLADLGVLGRKKLTFMQVRERIQQIILKGIHLKHFNIHVSVYGSRKGSV